MRLSLSSFPSFLVPVAIYNLVAVFTSMFPAAFGPTADAVGHALLNISMPAPGTVLKLSLGDLILVIGFVSLFLELASSTSSSNQALLGDALTIVLFVIGFIEFLLLSPFATATFFLLLIMILIDAVAGFIVSAVSARADIEVGN